MEEYGFEFHAQRFHNILTNIVVGPGDSSIKELDSRIVNMYQAGVDVPNWFHRTWREDGCEREYQKVNVIHGTSELPTAYRNNTLKRECNLVTLECNVATPFVGNPWEGIKRQREATDIRRFLT